MASAKWIDSETVEFQLGTHVLVRKYKAGDEVNFPELDEKPVLDIPPVVEQVEVLEPALDYSYTRDQLEAFENFKDLREFARPYGIKGTGFEEIINELMAAKEAN